MHLSLIGMSGTGKSYWSSQLSEKGFTLFCCDALIAKRLKEDLTTPDGEVLSMGDWMGFPYQSNYQEREAKYLRHELDVLNEILTYLEIDPRAATENIIVDTTGSVIYAGDDLLRRLRRLTTIVYLDTPLEVQERMRLAYVSNPPPVLWRDKFVKQPHETNQEALANSYPALLASRTQEYKKLTEVTLDYYRLRQEGFTVNDFLDEIKQQSLSLAQNV